jgi:AraC-like DNA-binding protein
MASEGNQREITPAMRSALGHTRDGAPLSNNRAPESELSPWIARIWATKVETEPDQTIACGMFADTPVLRVLFSGDWTAETIYGLGRYGKSALFFGPQTKRMPITVSGNFATLSVALKPGAVETLGGPPIAHTLDRIIRFDDIFADHRWWGSSEQLVEWLDPAGPPERWLRVAEKLFRQFLDLKNCPKPNPVVEAFDIAAFANPNFNIGEFAEENAIERRTLERLIKRAYGLTPKQVLRRARVMDMAANLLGVGDNAESEELALRYYDQSHMIREFSSYFGVTPKQFASTPQPLMTLTLEARQSRRLEVLGRKAPGVVPPWRKEG